MNITLYSHICIFVLLEKNNKQVLSDQAEQVNTKRNNTNNLTAYGQKMINDSNIINMIPQKQRYKSCIKNSKILVKKRLMRIVFKHFL